MSKLNTDGSLAFDIGIAFAVPAVSRTPPTITSLSVSSASQWDAATLVTVTGTGYTLASVVNVNGTAQTTTYIDPTSVSWTIPTSLTTGSALQTAAAYSITVTESGLTSAASTFTVTAWTPNTPSGIKAWFRGDLGVTTGATYTWANQVTGGGNSLAQGTGVNQPSAPAAVSGANNQVGIAVTASQFLDQQVGNIATWMTSQSGTIFAILYPTTVSHTSATFDNDDRVIGDGSFNLGISLATVGGTPKALSGAYTPSVHSVSVTAPGINNVYIIEWKYDGATIYGRSSEGTEGTAACTGSYPTSSSFRVGAGSTGFQGSFLEFIVYNVKISDTDRDRLTRYAKVRYAAA